MPAALRGFVAGKRNVWTTWSTWTTCRRRTQRASVVAAVADHCLAYFAIRILRRPRLQPPRLIAKDLGGLNGFEVGPDGMIYGPLWFKRSVVRVDPANGAVSVISASSDTPAAANLDGKGHVWVVDTANGEVAKVALDTGAKTVVATLATALDNLAIAPDGTVYVSNLADNSIQAINPADGSVRTLTRGKLAVPSGIKIDGNTMWVADVLAHRLVDLASGEVTDLKCMQTSDLEYPFALGLSSKRLALASWFTGTVQVINRASGKTETM